SATPSTNTRGSVATNATAATAATVVIDTSGESGYEVEDVNININEQRARSRASSQLTRKILLDDDQITDKDDIQSTTHEDRNQPVNLWKKPAFTPLLPPIEECPPECPNKSLIPKCSKCFQPLRRPIGRCNCKQLPTCESSCQHYPVCPAMISRSVFPCNEFSMQTCSSPVCRPVPFDSHGCRTTQTFPQTDFPGCFDNYCLQSAPVMRHKAVQTRGQDDFSVNFVSCDPGIGMKRDCCVMTFDDLPQTCTIGTYYNEEFDCSIKPVVENACCKCTNFPEPIDQISLAPGRESRRMTFKEDDKSRRSTFVEDLSQRSVILQNDEKERECSMNCRFLVPTKYTCRDCGREHEPAKSAFDGSSCNCAVGPDPPILSSKCNFCDAPPKCNCGMPNANNLQSQHCSCGLESPQLQPQQPLLYPVQSNFTQQPPTMGFPGTFKSFAGQNSNLQNKYTAYEPPKYFIVNQFTCTYNNEDDKITEMESSGCSCVKCNKDCCECTSPYLTDDPIAVDQSTSIGILNNTQDEQSFRFFHFEYNVNKCENSCYCSDDIKCSSNCIRNRTNKSTQFGKLLRLNIDKCSCDESVKCSAECIKYQDRNPVTYQHKSNQYSLDNDNFEQSKLNALLNNIVSNLKDNTFKTSNSILKCTKHKYNREFDMRGSNLESIEEESMSYELAPEHTSSHCAEKSTPASDFNSTKSTKQPKEFDIDKCYCKDTSKCASKCVRHKISNRSKPDSFDNSSMYDKKVPNKQQEGPIANRLFERKQFDPAKFIPKCDAIVYRTNLPASYHQTETCFCFEDIPEGSCYDNEADLSCQTDCDVRRCCSFCCNFSHSSNQYCIEDNPCESDENANYYQTSCCKCDGVSEQFCRFVCSPDCDIYKQHQESSNTNECDTPRYTCEECCKFSNEDTANSKYRTPQCSPIPNTTQTNSENEMIRICRECCERNQNVIDSALKTGTSLEWESCCVEAKEPPCPRRTEGCPDVNFCDKNPLDISESEAEILISSYVPQSKRTSRTSRTSRTWRESSKEANGGFGERKYHYLMTDSSTEKALSFDKPASGLSVRVYRKGSSRASKGSKMARSSKANATKVALEANKRLVLDEQQKNSPVINRKLSPQYEDDNHSGITGPFHDDGIDDDGSILTQGDTSTSKKGEINRQNIPSLFEDTLVKQDKHRTVALQSKEAGESRPKKDEKKSHKWFKFFKKDKKNKKTVSIEQLSQYSEVGNFQERGKTER
ncbi:unnamed protein product, partial [Phyllotreta striolata]